MLQAIRSSFKNTLLYGIGNISVKLVGFILIPLYTDPQYLSINDFGTLALLEAINLLLIALFELSIPQSLTRWFWDPEAKKDQKSIFFTSFVFQSLSGIAISIILISLSENLSIAIFNNVDWTKVIKVLIISSFLQSINNLINSLLRAEFKAILFTLANTFKLILVLFLTIYFITKMKIGIEGIFISQLAGNLLFILILSPTLVKRIKLKFEYSYLKDMLGYGFPLMIASIFTISLNIIDRYTLNSISTLQNVAIYSMAFKVASILKIVVVESFKMAISPIMIKKINASNSKQFYARVLKYSQFSIMIFIIIISIFSFELLNIISRSKEYLAAIPLIPILSVSIFFVLSREVIIYGLIIVKRTKIISLLVIGVSMINLILNIILIQHFDTHGAAVASLITQIIYTFVIYLFSQKSFFIPYDLKRYIIVLVLGTLLAFIGVKVNGLSLAIRIISKVGIVLSYPIILYFLNFYDFIELSSLKGFIKKWSNLKKISNNISGLKNNINEFENG